MKYSELVKFEPIESVIQLEQAGARASVKQLVETFVISKGMSEQLCDIVLPNLQFEKAADNKGVLIVGSGNLVHNLHAYAWGRKGMGPYDWAVRFGTIGVSQYLFKY